MQAARQCQCTALVAPVHSLPYETGADVVQKVHCCHTCGKRASKLSCCNKCKHVYYCDRTCQVRTSTSSAPAFAKRSQLHQSESSLARATQYDAGMFKVSRSHARSRAELVRRLLTGKSTKRFAAPSRTFSSLSTVLISSRADFSRSKRSCSLHCRYFAPPPTFCETRRASESVQCLACLGKSTIITSTFQAA